MIGTAFIATRSRWLIMEVKRKVCGRISTRTKATIKRAAHLHEQQCVLADLAMVRPTLSKRGDQPCLRPRGSGDNLWVPACIFSNRPRSWSSKPTIRVSQPWLLQARSARSMSQAP